MIRTVGSCITRGAVSFLRVEGLAGSGLKKLCFSANPSTKCLLPKILFITLENESTYEWSASGIIKTFLVFVQNHATMSMELIMGYAGWLALPRFLLPRGKYTFTSIQFLILIAQNSNSQLFRNSNLPGQYTNTENGFNVILHGGYWNIKLIFYNLLN